MTKETFIKIYNSVMKEYGFIKIRSMYYMYINNTLGCIRLFKSNFGEIYYLHYAFSFRKYENSSEYPNYYDTDYHNRICAFNIEEIFSDENLISKLRGYLNEYVIPVVNCGKEYFIDNLSYGHKRKYDARFIVNDEVIFSKYQCSTINKTQQDEVGKIVEFMRWDHTEEEKKQGYQLAEKVIDIQYLMIPFCSGVEEHCADILCQKSDEELLPHTYWLMFYGMRDLSKPYGSKVFERLKKIKDGKIDEDAEYYVSIAERICYTSLADNLKKLLFERSKK